MLLAVDTSTRVVGIALYDGIRVLSEISWFSGSYHTVQLGPAVADMLKRVDVKSEELEAIGVAIGPGSFTGLRIGLAFAKGLALSRRIPIIGVLTLDVLAYAQPTIASKLAAVLEAGRGRLAVGWYHQETGNWQFTGHLENLTIDTFVDRIQELTQVCGELGKDLRTHLSDKGEDVIIASPAQSFRRPAFLAELAWRNWENGKVDDPSLLKPIYLHHGKPIPG